MIPGSASPLLLKSAAAAPAGDYQIERSLRFNSSDSGFLSRTPAVAGNRQTWTWAGWVKRSALGSTQRILFGTGNAGNDGAAIRFNGSDQLEVYEYLSGSFYYNLISTQVFRDPSSFGHLVVSVDTSQATSSNRIKIYWNGSQITAFGTSTYPSSDYLGEINTAVVHGIGRGGSHNDLYFSGCLAEVFFIDGQALDHTSFTEVSATTGQLIPLAYSGTFGTNGFWLKFSDNSALTSGSNVGVGKDYSGNANYFNTSGLSVTAGAGNDSLVDTPTSVSATDTGIGGEIRGNYCTLNPLANNGGTLSNGNYDHSGTTAITAGTLFPSSGKWYFEVTCNTYSGGGSLGYTAIGVIKSDQSINTIPTSIATVPAGLWSYRHDALKVNNGASASYGNTWNAGDVIGVAFDVDAGKVWFAKNGSWQASGDPAAGTNAAYTNLSGSIGVAINDQGTYATTYSLNAGARPFAYTAPSGFKALCDTNIAEGTITTSGTFTGNASADGPFVYLNGVPTAMTINSNAVTFATHADKLSNGFKLRTSSGSYNTAGSNSYSITTTGAKFKYARAQPNP